MTDTTPSQSSLIQQSIAIIRQKKNLLIFPTVSTIVMIAAFSFAFTLLYHMESAAWDNNNNVTNKTYAVFITIFLAVFLVIGLVTLSFNAALTACTLKHIRQEPYTLSLGFKTMITFFWKILMIKIFYDGIAFVVKLMRYWVDDWSRSPLSMNLVSGLPWNDAVLLIIPVLVVENTSFLETLRRSAQLITNKWGQDVTLRSGLFSHMLSLAGLISLIPIVIGAIIGGNTAITIGMVITMILTITKTIIHSTTQVISSCALYLYATDVDTSHFFDAELLKKAFRPLTRKELHIS